ncbi:MAG: ABC transporter substrate-binding protein, partial [Deltaproteobacteria bacterium]|nr:ABC transporter substrate-binding protein [Deltaproteobacteria bacterium]
LESLPVEHLEATGPREVRMTLSHPVSFLRFRLAEVVLLPAQTGSCQALDDLQQVIGTGPFRLTLTPEPGTLRLRRFEHYWVHDEVLGQLPLLDEVVLAYEPDPGQALGSLAAGRAQIALLFEGTGAELSSDALRAAGLRRWPIPARGFYLSVLEVQSPPGSPLVDARVRQSLGWSLNREEQRTEERAPIGRFLDHRFDAFSPVETGYGFDPVRAKALLEEAGLGGEEPLPVLRLGCLTLFEERCAWIETNLEALGWRVDRHVLLLSSLQRSMEAQQIDLTVGGFTHPIYGSEPWPYLMNMVEELAQEPTVNPALREALDALDRSESPSERRGIYQRIERLLLEDAHLIPLFTEPADRPVASVGRVVLRPEVRGLLHPVEGGLPPLRGLTGQHQVRMLTNHHLAGLARVWLAPEAGEAASPSGE